MAVGVLGLRPDGRAQEGLVLGPVKAYPHLDVAMTYDDNVLISSAAKQGDFYATISPGIRFAAGQSKLNHLELDYTAALERFVELTGQDTDNHTVDLQGRAVFNRLSVTVKDTFQDGAQPNIEVGTRLRQQQNTAQAEAEYRFSQKSGVGMDFEQNSQNSSEAGLFNTQQYDVGGTYYYGLSPKTDLFGRFGYGRVDQGGGGNATYQEADLGVRGQLTSKITGSARVGYQHWVSDRLTGASDSLVAEADLTAQFTKRTSAKLGVSRDPQASIYALDTSYLSTQAELTLRHRLGRTIDLTAGGSIERRSYSQTVDGVNRQDDVWQATISIDDKINKWCTIGVQYQFQQNDTTDPATAFTQNIATVHALVSF